MQGSSGPCLTSELVMIETQVHARSMGSPHDAVYSNIFLQRYYLVEKYRIQIWEYRSQVALRTDTLK